MRGPNYASASFHGRREAGFTLAEILVVIALLTCMAGFSLVVSFDQYRGTSLRDERARLVAALQHARAEAIEGKCSGDCTGAQPHGVAILDNAYVLFQGDTFATRDPSGDDTLDANSTIVHGGADEIVFEPVSGDASENGVITLTDSIGKTATITIEAEGRIFWSD